MKLAAPEGPQPPCVPPPPETRQTSIFLSYSLYTSMVTKNKFFNFPARLTSPGSRSHSRHRVKYVVPFPLWNSLLVSVFSCCVATLSHMHLLIEQNFIFIWFTKSVKFFSLIAICRLIVPSFELRKDSWNSDYLLDLLFYFNNLFLC